MIALGCMGRGCQLLPAKGGSLSLPDSGVTLGPVDLRLAGPESRRTAARPPALLFASLGMASSQGRAIHSRAEVAKISAETVDPLRGVFALRRPTLGSLWTPETAQASIILTEKGGGVKPTACRRFLQRLKPLVSSPEVR